MIPFVCVPTARHGWTGGQRESAGFNTLRLPVQFDGKPELVPIWEAVEVICPTTMRWRWSLHRQRSSDVERCNPELETEGLGWREVLECRRIRGPHNRTGWNRIALGADHIITGIVLIAIGHFISLFRQSFCSFRNDLGAACLCGGSRHANKARRRL